MYLNFWLGNHQVYGVIHSVYIRFWPTLYVTHLCTHTNCRCCCACTHARTHVRTYAMSPASPPSPYRAQAASLCFVSTLQAFTALRGLGLASSSEQPPLSSSEQHFGRWKSRLLRSLLLACKARLVAWAAPAINSSSSSSNSSSRSRRNSNSRDSFGNTNTSTRSKDPLGSSRSSSSSSSSSRNKSMRVPYQPPSVATIHANTTSAGRQPQQPRQMLQLGQQRQPAKSAPSSVSGTTIAQVKGNAKVANK